MPRPIGKRLFVSRYGGNDNNDGLTPNTPLRTIQAAVNKLEKDAEEAQRITIEPGYYEENVRVNGFRDSTVVLAGEKNERPMVDSINFGRCEGAKVLHMSFSGNASVGLICGKCEDVSVDSSIFTSTRQGLVVEGCNRVKIDDSRITNASGAGMTITDSTAWVTTCTIKDAPVGIVANTSTVYSKGNDINCPQKYQNNGSQIIES